MRFKLALLRELSVLMLLLFSGTAIAQEYQDRGTLPGVIRVKLKENSPLLQKADFYAKSITTTKGVAKQQTQLLSFGLNAFDAMSSKYHATNMKRVFPHAGKHEAKQRKHGLHLWYEIRFENHEKATTVAHSFKGIEGVELAKPVYKKVLAESKPIEVKSAEANEGMPFNDPFLGMQWHYDNTGQRGGLPGADISAFEAWELTGGSREVIVAIVDGGVDANHEDLKENMWVNNAELYGDEGVDDDDNGYIDDINGFNFVYWTGQIEPHYHGTHVAGTVAAVNNNGRGVSGVAGGTGHQDGIRMMTTQTMTEEYSGDPASAIVYGANNGAIISQNSWGYLSPEVYEEEVLAAIQYFIDEAGDYEGSPMKGGVVIFSSGNDDSNANYYPGSYPPVINVASTNIRNDRAYYSNYGPTIDLSAPGGETIDDYYSGVLSTLPGSSYGYLQGTSMACPHVSGVAALIVSHLGGEGFTNKMLEQRLIGGTDAHTNALYEYYEGKMGSGTLNAFKAMQKEYDVAPNPVVDMEVVDFKINQDNKQTYATFEWSVPEATKNGVPYKYEFYAYYETFTLEQMENMMVEIVYPKIGKEKISHIETNLLGKDLYVRVIAVDMFGRKSVPSDLMKIPFPNIPQATIDTTPIVMNVDVTSNTKIVSSFNISNTIDQTTLFWETALTHLSVEEAKVVANYPTAANASEVGEGKLKLYAASEVSSNTVAIQNDPEIGLDVASENDFIANIGYDNPYLDAEGFLGFDNPFYSLATSTRFEVPEGMPYFSLTHLEFVTSSLGHDDPVIIEIRKGGETPLSGELIHVQEAAYTGINGAQLIALSKNFTFEEGDKIWANIIFPRKYGYVAGINEMPTSQVGRFYLSMDAGENYYPLEQLLEVENIAMKIRAFSVGKGWDMPFFALEPSKGEIKGTNTQNVAVTLDAKHLQNGLHKSKISVNTNASYESTDIPVEFTVSGQKAKPIINKNILEFGSNTVGVTKNLQVAIFNDGLAKLEVLGITSDNDKFSVLGSQTLSLEPGHYRNIGIDFSSEEVGLANGHITIETNEGNIKLPVVGSSVEAPKLNVTEVPKDIAINFEDTTTVSLTFQNDGKYPLNYSFPQIDPHTATNELRTDGGYGYSFKVSNEEGGPSAGLWEDISVTGTEIPSNLSNGDNVIRVDMNHAFTFYGETFNALFITENGIVGFEPPYNTASVSAFATSGFASNASLGAFWHDFQGYTGGLLYYQSFEDRTIVQWNKMESMSQDFSGKMTFQIVLFIDGTIQYRYKDVMSATYKEWGTAVGMKSPTGEHMLNVAYNDASLITNGTVIEMTLPTDDIVVAASEMSGTLAVGASKTVTFDVAPKQHPHYHGSHQVGIVLQTNDPNAARYTANFNMTVEGKAVPTFLQKGIAFNTLMVGESQIKSVYLVNAGSRAMTMNIPTFNDDAFSTSLSSSQSIAPKDTLVFEVIYKPTASKESFETSFDVVIDEVSFNMPMRAEAIDAPAAGFSEENITVDLAYGNSKKHQVTITNTATEGNTRLDFTVGLPSTASFLKNEALPNYEGTDGKFGYYFMDSRTSENKADAYEWIDIQETGSQVYMEGSFANLQALPFEFPFYGKVYEYMFVGSDGFLAVDFPLASFPPYTADLPRQGDYVKGVIAPFWAYLVPHYAEGGGVYTQSFEDMYVVQWVDVPQYYAAEGIFRVTFQVILYKDGRIKFQYKDVEEHTDVVSIGIEGEDEAYGMSIKNSYAPEFVRENEMAYTIYPPTYYSLKNGESVTLDFLVDANTLIDGTYNESLNIHTNDPLNRDKSLNFTLNVKGDYNVTATESLDFGYVFVENGQAVKTYTKDVWVRNNGTKDVRIKGFHFNSGKFQDPDNGLEIVQSGGYPFYGNLNDDKDFEYEYQYLYVDAGDSINFKVNYQPQAVGNFEDALYLRILDGTETVLDTIPMMAVVSEPSMLEENVADISMNILPTATEEGSFDLSNKGNGTLTYDLYPVWNRVDPVVEKEPAMAAAMSAAPKHAAQSHRPASDFLVAKENVNFGLQSISEAETKHFTDSLQYTIDMGPKEPTYSVGFYGEAVYLATKYVAGSQGFALTHFESYIYNSGLPEANINIQVRVGGDNPADARTIHNQDFEVGSMPWGAWELYKFDSTLFINPNETFYVVTAYEEGILEPQGGYDLGYYAKNGYFFYSDNGGKDWETTGYGIELRVRALSDASFDWLTLPAVGEIAKEGTTSLEWAVDASKAKPGNNNVRIMFGSNDPHNSVASFDLNCYVNRAPVFANAIASDSIPENSTINVEFALMDYENEALTVALTEENEMAAVTYDAETGLATLAITAGYEDAGEYTFNLLASDASGLTETHTFALKVKDVNRLPELALSEVSVPLWEEYYVFDNSVFTDADGDAVVVGMNIEDNTVAQAVARGNEFVIIPFQAGTTNLEITLNDNRGEAVTQTVQVTVIAKPLASELEEVVDFNVYPNPVEATTTMSYTLPEHGMVTLEIFDIIGQPVKVIELENQTIGNHKVEINLSELTSGVYIYHFNLDYQNISSGKIIKK